MKAADSGSVEQLDYVPFGLVDRVFLVIPYFLILMFSSSMYGERVILCIVVIELCIRFKVRHNSTLYFVAVAVVLVILSVNQQTPPSFFMEMFIILFLLPLRLFLWNEWNNSHVRKADLLFTGFCMFFGFLFSVAVLPGTFTVLKNGSLEFTDDSFSLINPLTLAEPIDNRPLAGIIRIHYEGAHEPIENLEVVYIANPELITSVAVYKRLREMQEYGIRDVPTSARVKEEISDWIQATYPFLRVSVSEQFNF